MDLLQKLRNKKASSRIQISMRGVCEGILQLPNNQNTALIEVSSINFELKSEDEQDAIIDTYESFLNSLGHPIQIIIRTRELDMDKYLAAANEKLHAETEAVFRNQLQNYDEFIRSLTTNNKILTRTFYLAVPYHSHENEDFILVKGQLSLLVDIIIKGLGRMGIQSRILSSLEILDLFYSFYSPEQAKIQPLTNQVLRQIHSNFIKKAVSV